MKTSVHVWIIVWFWWEGVAVFGQHATCSCSHKSYYLPWLGRFPQQLGYHLYMYGPFYYMNNCYHSTLLSFEVKNFALNVWNSQVIYNSYIAQVNLAYWGTKRQMWKHQTLIISCTTLIRAQSWIIMLLIMFWGI